MKSYTKRVFVASWFVVLLIIAIGVFAGKAHNSITNSYSITDGLTGLTQVFGSGFAWSLFAIIVLVVTLVISNRRWVRVFTALAIIIVVFVMAGIANSADVQINFWSDLWRILVWAVIVTTATWVITSLPKWLGQQPVTSDKKSTETVQVTVTPSE